MKRDVCSFSLSFFMHAASLGIFFYVCPALDLQPKPLLIDFSLISAGMVSGKIAAEPSQKQKTKQAPVLKVPPRPRELARLKPIEKIIRKEKPNQLVAQKQSSRPVEKILPKKQEKTVQEEQLPEPAGTVPPAPMSAAAPKVPVSAAPKTVTPGAGEPGAATGGETGKALEQHYVKAHFVYIKKIIEKKISYPPIARRMGWQGKVLVSFIVCQDGRVESLEIVESSGHVQLDSNALETVRQAEPFPRPPVRVKLVLPVTYRLG